MKPWTALEPLAEAELWFEESKHYQFFSPEGIAETHALVPKSGHTIIHNDDGGVYTLAMFHKLKCLEILQSALTDIPIENGDAGQFLEHCKNYLWQSVLCNADVHLESVWVPSNMSVIATVAHDYKCRDWGAVYDAVTST